MASFDVLPEAKPGQSFDAWLVDVRAAALAAGMAETTLDVALDGMTESETVIRLDRAQAPNSVTPSFSTYLSKRLTPQKIARGLNRKQEVADAVSYATQQYGVPSGVLLAIWGMETNYGSYTGNFPILPALATLAYEGRRSELFRRELWAALQIIDRNMATPEDLRGSWAGAFGHTQFMPTSYLRFAVDGDGDGRRNLWSDMTDVFASTANYLVSHGWQAGLPWGFEVKVPATLDRAALRQENLPEECSRVIEKHSRWLTAAEWQTLGLVATSAGQVWPAPETPMSLVEPDGPDGPAFLTTENYRAFLEYNCSNFYALSVAQLADALDG
ncbi:lytic murein transglycosylase [Pedomonas mirosovicensis]|uniref:lytic murein transglycosylase n=1 Tax=Pedomonas mirosovicensis TaxID=2908641 RepID=UPI0021695AA4|nr:lytic murein transglycosylase [Pedomonas mirosovicensis]MCH8685273.1 lytic murein transglycosylase [Pedomonas mirosovicensis]